MAGTTKYRLGEFFLDPGSYSLLRDSKALPISRKPFQVLIHLIEQRDRVVTRQELLQEFWEGREVYEENLTKCISEIRRALGDQQKPHRFIETLPAIGYRYIGPLQERVARQSASAAEGEAARVPDIAASESLAEAQHSDSHHGPSPTETTLPVQSVPDRSSARTGVIVSVLIVLALAAAAFAFYPNKADSASAARDSEPIRSLAILPFKPISEKHRDVFLELGMADALITNLSSIRQIVVTPTSSVRKYTDLTVSPTAAGKELGVESVLEGSLQMLDERIRVTVRLVKVADGSCLWAETFDEKLADIFTLQDTISERVANGLAVRLSTQEKERITKRYTESSEAYQLYQKGRYFWDKRTENGLKKSIGFFEEAITKDPHYALAYAGLADSYLVQFTFLPPREVFPKVKQAALKALDIDDTIAEPHAALAFATLLYDRDWNASDREFRRAFELNPNNGLAHQRHAVSLVAAGHSAEAIAEATRAQESEPLSLAMIATAGWVSFLAREYDQTIEQCSKSIEMDPSFAPAYVYRAMAYEQKGMLDSAIADLETARSLQPGPALFGTLGHAYAISGNKAKARMLLRELNALSAKQYFPAFQIALIHIGLGEKDEAFALLEKSYEDHYPWLIHLNVEPRLDPIREDPRFARLLRRVGLGI